MKDKPEKYPVHERDVIVFYLLFFLFILSFLAGIGRYYQLIEKVQKTQREELTKLWKQIDFNKQFNNNQNFSLTEIEERLKKLEEN